MLRAGTASPKAPAGASQKSSGNAASLAIDGWTDTLIEPLECRTHICALADGDGGTVAVHAEERVAPRETRRACATVEILDTGDRSAPRTSKRNQVRDLPRSSRAIHSQPKTGVSAFPGSGSGPRSAPWPW